MYFNTENDPISSKPNHVILIYVTRPPAAVVAAREELSDTEVTTSVPPDPLALDLDAPLS